MIEVGLTGGIGSGKSTVASLLVDRGAVLIDADQVVRDLQRPGAPVFLEMIERWGDGIVAADGTLDRGAVAAIVFGDDAELEALNKIVHPAVAEEMKRQRDELVETDKFVINDIPLLVKKRSDDSSSAEPSQSRPRSPEYAHLKGVIVVDTPPEVAVDRLVAFRGFTEDDARARIANQASRADRLAAADFVVDNSGSVDALEPQIDACWKWLESLRPSV